MASSITQYRELLDSILNELIPANTAKAIPAAGDAGVGDFIEARASVDNRTADALTQLLSTTASMSTSVTPEMVAKLESSNAKHFLLLLNLTYMGYYSRPEMRSLMGVGSWPVHPKGYEVPVEPADMIEKLTKPVKDRGPMYRNTNDDPSVQTS